MSFQKRRLSRSHWANGLSVLPIKGQMPFSMIAVILLILAGAGTALVYGVGESRFDREKDVSQLEELQKCAILESSEVEQIASVVAMAVSYSNDLGNESEMQSKFRSALQEEISNSYPQRRGDITVQLAHSSIDLRFLRLNAADANDVEQTQLKDQIGVSSYTIPVYLELIGNYSLKLEASQCSITRDFDVHRTIHDPSPFLSNRLQIFQSAFEGGKNEIENLVRYQVAALSQDRVLSGAGSGTLAGTFSLKSVITDQDVRNALNLAILIEQMKVFRTCDEVFLDSVLGQFPCSDETRCNVEALLHSGGQVDVADLFLLLNDGGHYSLRQILAQSIYSSADVLVLRWLDYLHIVDLEKALEQIQSGVETTVSNLVESMTGVDLIEESMARWMSERFREAGIHDYDYRWLHYASSDSYVAVDMNSFDFQNHLGDDLNVVVQGNYDIDFPSFDVLSSSAWKDFVIGYKTATCQLARNFELFVKSVALNVASNANLPDIVLKLDAKDPLNYLDELLGSLKVETDSCKGWFEGALEQTERSFTIKDPLGQALAEYARTNWRELFQLNSSVGMAESDMAKSIVNDAIAATSFSSDTGGMSEINVVEAAIQNDESWGVDASIRKTFEIDIGSRLDLFDQVFGDLPWEGQTSPLQRLIATLAADAIDGVPGIKVVVSRLMERQISDLRNQAGIRADRILIQLPDSEVFSFNTENGKCIHESLVVHLNAPWADNPNEFLIDLQLPESFDPKLEAFPNHHLTDPLNTSMSPFESGFGISLGGVLQIELGLVKDSDSLLDRSNACMALALPFGFKSEFSCSSGWPLQDVEYRPTLTFDKQLGQFLDEIWNALVEALQLIGGACNQVFDFLKDCLSKLLSYCMQAVETLSDFLMNLAQGLRDMVQGAIGSAMKGLAASISATLGKIKCSISIGGLDMVLETCLPDMQFGNSRDLLKWTICVPLLGANLTFGVRIVEMVRSGLDILAFCKMAGHDWKAGLTVDPLMLIQDHLIEAECVFPSFSLELKAPEIVQYEKRSFRLSDIPVVGSFLSRIPTPIPGLLASVDAGFEVKYDNPLGDNVILNEVEFNPYGADGGNEWVELYNPTDEPVDISGWSLETVHGQQMSTILDDHVIQPKSYFIYQFEGQFLDNGGSNQLPVGESLMLKDVTGREIDSTSFLTDYYNDDRTWQRSLDASERWVFKSETAGSPNSFQPFPSKDIEIWYNTLYDATIRAFAKMGQNVVDLNSLAALIKNIITETVQVVAEILGRFIVEMSLFFELALQDYSQSLCGGIRLSLVITGDGVRDALLWMSSAVQQALAGIANPTQASMGLRPLDTILDDVHIRFSAYATAGLPRILADAASDARFRLAGSIQVSLASLIPAEDGQQNWSVSFGVLFEEVPGRLLNVIFPVDAEKSADCWLFRATIHASSSEMVKAAFVT